MQSEGSGAPARGHGGPDTLYGLTKAALDRFVTPELMQKNIAMVNVYPGMTVTERLLRMMPGMDTSWMERPETTAQAVAIICSDPMAYAGQILVARDVVAAHAA